MARPLPLRLSPSPYSSISLFLVLVSRQPSVVTEDTLRSGSVQETTTPRPPSYAPLPLLFPPDHRLVAGGCLCRFDPNANSRHVTTPAASLALSLSPPPLFPDTGACRTPEKRARAPLEAICPPLPSPSTAHPNNGLIMSECYPRRGPDPGPACLPIRTADQRRVRWRCAGGALGRGRLQ